MANQTHHSTVIIIITITAYHCSLFNVYQTVTACYCAKTVGCSAGCSGGNLFFCLQNMLFPFPLELFPFLFPISSSKLLPFLWESHGNGNSYSHAHHYKLAAAAAAVVVVVVVVVAAAAGPPAS